MYEKDHFDIRIYTRINDGTERRVKLAERNERQ